MKGLIRKELYLLRSGTGLLFMLASLLFAVAGGISDGDNFYGALAFFYVSLGAYSLMGMEEKWRFSTYIQCTPVSRFQIVLAKYAVALVQMLLNALIFALLNCFLRGGVALVGMLFDFSIALVVAALLYCLCFWLGASKGWASLLMCLVVLGGMGGAAFVAFSESGSGALVWIQENLWALPTAGLAVYAASCPLAAWLYRKRGK